MDNWFDNVFAEEVWKKKYAGEFSDIKNFFGSLAERVAQYPLQKTDFYNMMYYKRFSPGGRILAWGGRPDARISLMNCTTHSIEDDSLRAISTATEKVMKASSRGQGIGIDLSKLRPYGAPVNNAAVESTGAVSFMELINKAGEIIGQEGRRAALLFSLDVDHPDVWRNGSDDIVCHNCNGTGCMKCRGTGHLSYDFINIKNLPGKVEGANISVNITDEFIKAVKNDDVWELKFAGDNSKGSFVVSRKVPAKELFSALAYSAFASAEPGVLFVDNTARMSNSDLFGSRWKVVGVNACSEQLLDQEGVCNLGSLNLSAYVLDPFTSKARFDYKLFHSDINNAIKFLDNVLDIELEMGNYISDTQRASIEYLRRIGLGVMGFADTLAMMGLSYNIDNKETADFVERVFGLLRDTSYATSVSLAKRKGAAKVWETKDKRQRAKLVEEAFFGTLPRYLKEAIIEYGTRNITLLSVAPTGSISNLFGVSSGIEPLFAKSYIRRYRINGHEEFVDYVHPAVEKAIAAGKSDTLWDTAYEVSPMDHIKMQAAIQKYIDQAISKTTNMPETSTSLDVEEIYLNAYDLGIKGLAVYVNGSREKQILYQSDQCPECSDGGNVVREDGCKKCLTCGWSVCT